MIYFAHRGANTQRVENTVSAFALAQKQRVTHYELDVHLLKDGQLAVHHDYSLLRTAGVDVKLKDLASVDLAEYPLINPSSKEKVSIPLLQDVLPVILPNLKLLNIEIKNDHNIYPGIEEELLCLLRLHPQLEGKILISSFDYDTLVRVRTLSSNVRVGLLTRQFDIKKALALRAESVHINYIRFTPQIAQICHKNGLKVYCYTVTDRTLAAELAKQGVDGIFTNDVTLFTP